MAEDNGKGFSGGIWDGKNPHLLSTVVKNSRECSLNEFEILGSSDRGGDDFKEIDNIRLTAKKEDSARLAGGGAKSLQTAVHSSLSGLIDTSKVTPLPAEECASMVGNNMSESSLNEFEIVGPAGG